MDVTSPLACYVQRFHAMMYDAWALDDRLDCESRLSGSVLNVASEAVLSALCRAPRGFTAYLV